MSFSFLLSELKTKDKVQSPMHQDHVLGRFIAVRNDFASELDTRRREADKLGVGTEEDARLVPSPLSFRFSNPLFLSRLSITLSSLWSMFVTSLPYNILFLFSESGGL